MEVLLKAGNLQSRLFYSTTRSKSFKSFYFLPLPTHMCTIRNILYLQRYTFISCIKKVHHAVSELDIVSCLIIMLSVIVQRY